MSDDDPRQVAGRWLAEGRPARIVRVESVRGSTPREAGAAMVVSAEEVAGTVGGGPAEHRAIRAARAGLAAGTRPAERTTVSLVPAAGALCGGAMTLLDEPLTPATLATWPEPAVLFRLRLAGAGHVGRALVRVLGPLPCEVRWVDCRPDAFPPPPYPSRVTPVTTPTPAAMVAEMGGAAPSDAVVVATYDADLDVGVVRAALSSGARFCGLVGSQAKGRRVRALLADEGMPARVLARLACPVGLPGIAGKDPGVMAIAIAAQLLALPRDPAGPPDRPVREVDPPMR